MLLDSNVASSVDIPSLHKNAALPSDRIYHGLSSKSRLSFHIK